MDMDIGKICRFRLELNEEYVRKQHLNDKHIKELKEWINRLNSKFSPEDAFCKLSIPAGYIKIVGNDNEIALVEKIPCGEHKLKLEIPISFTVKEQRKWLETSSKFFKSKLTKAFETISGDKKFTKITKKPYREREGEDCDPDKPEEKTEKTTIRTLTFAHSAPYGAKSEKTPDYLKRIAWIKQRFNEITQQNPERFKKEIYYQIHQELAEKSFGSIKPYQLSTEQIRDIIRSKNKT